MKRCMLGLLVLACSGDKVDGSAKPGEPPATAKPGEPPAAAKPAAGFEGLTATLDDEPVFMKRALAKRQPDGSFQFYVSNKEASCEELMTNLFETREKPTTVLFTVSPRLAPDGARSMVLSWVSTGPRPSLRPETPVTISGTADIGTRVEIALELEAELTEGKLALRGSFSAEGCGEVDTSQTRGSRGMPLSLHPSTATITVAGHEFPVRGAIRKGKNLVLLDFPKDCGPATWFMSARVRHQRGAWYLDGSWFAKEQRTNPRAVGEEGERPIAFEIEPGQTGTSEDGSTVELSLSGSGQIGEYPVVLDGVVQALDCEG